MTNLYVWLLKAPGLGEAVSPTSWGCSRHAVNHFRESALSLLFHFSQCHSLETVMGMDPY